jgi:phenylacetate-CoA ligase
MVAPDVRDRSPQISTPSWAALDQVIQDPDAPAWNWTLGDRLMAQDLDELASLRDRLKTAPIPGDRPPHRLIARLRALAAVTPSLKRAMAEMDDAASSWTRLPTMARDDLTRELADFVPRNADLSRLIVYGTSGSSGRPLDLPHHPAAVGAHFILLERVLEAWGALPRFAEGRIAAWNVGAQADSAVFATPLAVWSGALWLKLSLHAKHWDRDRMRRFARNHQPLFLAGDPGGLAELLAWDVDLAPAAIVSSAAHLDDNLARELRNRYSCPVIDTYATTETGPVAYAHPDGNGYALVADDLYLEAIDETGAAVDDGELTVSVARNPYLPLLRYRTGDFGRIERTGNGLRLVELRARRSVVLRAKDGSALILPDVARIIQRWPVLSFRCVQRGEGCLDIALRPIPGSDLDVGAVEDALRALLGPGSVVRATADPALGADGKKFEPFLVER